MCKYFLTSRHGGVGSTIMFHNKDERGYGSDIENLEKYTAEQAQRRHDQFGRKSLPLLVSKVIESSKRRVDMQYIDVADGMPKNKNEICVVSIPSSYDGNDIEFIKSGSGRTFNLDEAEAKPACEFKKLGSQAVFWRLEYLLEKSRLTMQYENLNTRTMCRGVRLKRKYQKRDSGKTRWNCPSCGQISWQYDPYDFEGCKNINCNDWSY